MDLLAGKHLQSEIMGGRSSFSKVLEQLLDRLQAGEASEGELPEQGHLLVHHLPRKSYLRFESYFGTWQDDIVKEQELQVQGELYSVGKEGVRSPPAHGSGQNRELR